MIQARSAYPLFALIAGISWGLLWVEGCIFVPRTPLQETPADIVPAAAAVEERAPSSKAPFGLPHDPILPDVKTLSLCRRWQSNLVGRISYISMDGEGSKILTSTSGEKHGMSNAVLRLFNENGKVLWSKPLNQSVRAQAMSSDGTLMAATTFADKLHVFTEKGKELFALEHLGRPVFLTSKKKLMVFNDEDSEISNAFFLYDLEGKLLAAGPNEFGEPIYLGLAPGESWFILTYPKGRLTAFDSDGNPIWKGQIGGEINALTLSAPVDGKFQFEVAFTVTEKGESDQNLARYSFTKEEKDLKVLWETAMDPMKKGYRFGAMHAALDSDALMLYGNTKTNQAIGGYRISDGSLLFLRSYQHAAQYSSFTFAGNSLMTVAVDTGEKEDLLTIFGLQANGFALWSTPIVAPDGIYSYAVSRDGRKLAIGSGDPLNGYLQFYSDSPRSRCK